MTDPLRLDAPLFDELLARLTLERKVHLLTGRDLWSTHPLEEIGLRSIVLSDGPTGVRGVRWDERDPSLNLPSASSLSASWDPGVARRYAEVMSVEARRKGVDVVLGPTINLHRSPLGGRHFEAFSEDPRLTADLATAYVQGIQSQGVAATPKHYVANDYETERYTASTDVSERALREVYLLAFERPVVDGRAWLVMSAYNRVNGTLASEHPLLETPLNSEWGFDGVVVSDWTGVRTLAAAEASQDLVMPGPDGPWGDALVAAVRAGDIDEAVVDRKVRRMLLLAARVGALDGVAPAVVAPDGVEDIEDGVAFARWAAAEGSVLLRNEGLLPLDAASLSHVAVIGDNARRARTQGGGAAAVVPEHVVDPLAGIRAALPDATVTYARGCTVQEGVAELPVEELRDPVSGDVGVRVRFRDADGHEILSERRATTQLVYLGGDAPITAAETVEVETTWTPSETGRVGIGVTTLGRVALEVDGATIWEGELATGGGDPGEELLNPPSVSVPIDVEAGAPLAVRLVLDRRDASSKPALRITLGTEPHEPDTAALIAEAAEVASAAELAIVVVGTNDRVESEGHDRADLRLPGAQDDLVAAVAATGTPTVVVVNSGSPVLLPWRDDVEAILLSWFGGQQMGEALADVLLGDVEPGGRLPTTWPAAEADVPVLDVTPVAGVLSYDEGIHVGYRAWLRAGVEPAYGFGHGLGYTTWDVGGLEVLEHATPARDARLTVEVTNTGDRAGKEVVQLYLARPDSAIDRPVRWLAAHAVVRAEPGETRTVELVVPSRAFAHWDDGWRWETGRFQAHAGTSVAVLPLTADVEVAAG